MLHLRTLCLIGLFSSITLNASASILKAFKIGPAAFENSAKMLRLSFELVEAKFPFTGEIIYLEALKKNDPLNLKQKSIETFSEKIIRESGSALFELLKNHEFRHAPSSVSYYYQAKKSFKAKKYDKALNILRKVEKKSSLSPFALHMEAGIYALKGQNKKARKTFLKCRKRSNRYIGSKKFRPFDHQYVMNKAYCTVGIGRTFFNQKSLNKSDRAYQFLEKANLIWPEILFEEGWVYHNMGQFNRTLGKMSSYKSPFLSFVYNPEIYILRALSYLKLCQYRDVMQVRKEFWNRYKDITKVKDLVLNKKNSYAHLYNRYHLIKQRGNHDRLPLIDGLILYIGRKGHFQELYGLQRKAEQELDKLKIVAKKIKTRTSLKKFAPFVENYLIKYLERNLSLRKNMMGHLIQKYLVRYFQQVLWVKRELEVIRLEQLAQIREILYKDNMKRDRGDIRFLQRNQFQYFWKFNGEFWADELGDYVFALPNLCQKSKPAKKSS